MGFYPARADYNDGVISVDEALNNPTTITERVAEVAGRDLLVETIFSTDSTPVQGGAVIYSKTTEKNFYTDNDVTARQPGDEYGIVYRERPAAELARVEDYGGKFAVSDEARRRNDNVTFDNDVTALANTVTRKLNQRAIETLQAAETAGEIITGAHTGATWESVRIDGPSDLITPPIDRPISMIAHLIAIADSKELGIKYTKLLVSPRTKAEMLISYGQNLKPMLDTYELDLVASTYVPDDRSYLIDPGKAGFVKYEEPLTVTTWRDEAHRQTWVQAYAMPVMGITLPAAVAAIEYHTEENTSV